MTLGRTFNAAAMVVSLLIAVAFAGSPSATTESSGVEKFQIGDRLRISVPDLFSAGRTTTVTPLIEADSKIGLLLIKPVAATGLTADQLADNIAQAYSDAHLISNADVKVECIDHSAEASPRPPLLARDRITVRIWDLEAQGTDSHLTRQLDEHGEISLPHLKRSIELSGLSERDAATKIAGTYVTESVLNTASVEVVRNAK